MATTIITKNGSGAPAAGDLVQGELAVDLTNQTLYSKDSSGNVFKVGDTGGGSPGTFTDLVATDSFTSPGIDDNATSTQITVTDTDVDFSGNIDVTGTATLPDADVTTLDVTGTTTLADVDVVDLDVTGSFTSPGIDDNATSTAITIDANENVGIGTTSPFGPLDVKAATDIHVGIADSGSDALIYASTDAGQTAVVPLKFQGSSFKFNGSSEFMRIDASGNVGIGYNSPTAKLHVLEDGSPCALTVQALGASNTATLNLLGRDSSNVSVAYKIQTVADGALSFSKDSNERLRIDAAGTTTVTGGFLAAQPSAGSGAFAAGTDAGAISQSASAVAVGNAAGYTGQGANTVAVGLLAGRTNQGQDSVAIGKYSGNNTQGGQAVAIGVSAGQTTQQGSAVAVGRQAGETDQGFASVATGYQAGQLRQGGYGVAVGHAAGLSDQGARSVAVGLSAGQVNQGASSVAIGHLAGQTNQAANSIVISSLGSAANAPEANSIRLISSSTKYLHYNGTNAWTFTGGDVKVPADDLVVGTSSTVGNGVSTAGVQLTTNPSGVGQIRLGKTLSGTYSMLANYHNGVFVGGLNVSNTTTALVASSDERLKKNIVDAPAGNIEDIKVRSFDWKSTDEHQEYGVIAQELNEVAPYAVHHNEEEDHWGVDYASLVPMLVKEIQDLKAEVAALKGA
jgi:hypothetical protein